MATKELPPSALAFGKAFEAAAGGEQLNRRFYEAFHFADSEAPRTAWRSWYCAALSELRPAWSGLSRRPVNRYCNREI